MCRLANNSLKYGMRYESWEGRRGGRGEGGERKEGGGGRGEGKEGGGGRGRRGEGKEGRHLSSIRTYLRQMGEYVSTQTLVKKTTTAAHFS